MDPSVEPSDKRQRTGEEPIPEEDLEDETGAGDEGADQALNEVVEPGAQAVAELAAVPAVAEAMVDSAKLDIK